MKRVFRILAILSLPMLIQPMLSAQESEGQAPASQPAPAARPELDNAIHDYLLAHPEVVLESVRSYDMRQKRIAADRTRDKVRAHLAELTGSDKPLAASATASDAPVTIVEFFDYRCGFCKKAASTVAGLGATPGVRVVYKEMPILGSDSMVAAEAALAARAQGGYDKLHNAMLASESPLTPALIDKLAADAGLDVQRLKTDMQSPQVSAEISRNLQLAQTLDIESTPTFVVGDQLVKGALTPQAFSALIQNARGSQVAVARVDAQHTSATVR